MPQGQRSKRRAHDKCIWDRNDSKGHKRVRAAAVVQDESPSCSFSVLEGNPQVSSSTETSSISQGSWTASSTTIATNSDQCDESQDEGYSFSSNALSSVNPSSDILAIKLEMVEQYLLHKYKMRQPILKEDILKIVGKDNQYQFADILKKGCDRIEAVFWVDLKEVDSSNHIYDLVSKLNLPNNGRVYAGNGFPKTGLLMSILGLIFTRGNRATEEDVWKFLNMLNIYAGRRHYMYGEPKRLIKTEFVKLKYLEYCQVPGSNPACYEFLWGPTAHAETSKMQVLEYFAKVNGTVPSALLPWYEEALQDQERARAIEEARAGTSATARRDTMVLASSTPSDV